MFVEDVIVYILQLIRRSSAIHLCKVEPECLAFFRLYLFFMYYNFLLLAVML